MRKHSPDCAWQSTAGQCDGSAWPGCGCGCTRFDFGPCDAHCVEGEDGCTCETVQYGFLGPPGPVVLPAPEELLPRRHGPLPGTALPVTGPGERAGEPTVKDDETGVRSHEPECRTARYIAVLGYDPDDAEYYCICPELHAYGDRLAAEALADLQAVVDGMRTDIARARQVPERRRRAPIGIVDTPAAADALEQVRQALDAAGIGTVDAGIAAQAKLLVLSHPMVTAEEVVAAGGTADPDMLIMLPVGGRELYPAFQYAPGLAYMDVRVLPVNWALDAANDPWGAASWWVSPHARLAGQAPVALLGTPDADQLLLLARAEGRNPNGPVT